MTSSVKVNSRNQIVVLAEVREDLGVGPGDRLIVSLYDGVIVTAREPDDSVEHTRGLGWRIWRECGACPD